MTTTEEFDLDALNIDSSGGAEVAKERSKRVSYNRVNTYISLKDKESIILRFLNDLVKHKGIVPWLTVFQHNFVPTKPKPDEYEGDNYPSKLTTICRTDDFFNGMFKDCYVCDVIVPNAEEKIARDIRRKQRTWALAAVRELVLDENTGKRKGIKTAMKEVAKVDEKGKPTGETTEVPDIRIANLAYKNFFAPIWGAASLEETVLKNDFKITRSGSGMDDTEYKTPMFPEIPLADWKGEPGHVLDLRDQEMRDAYFPGIPDLRRMLVDKATDEFLEKFFIPGKGNYSTDGPAAPSNDVDPARKAKLEEAIKARALQTHSDAAADEDSGLAAL